MPIPSSTTDLNAEPRQQEPKFGEWPYFNFGPAMWRNGREAGAHAAGIITGIPEHCAHIEVPLEFADGAALAMLAASMNVQEYSANDTNRTFQVRASWFVWEPASA